MLTQELKNLGLEGDVDDSAPSLLKYSTDASLFFIKPAVAVFPKTVNDLKKLVHFVSDEKAKGREISLTARAAGTDMTGGPLTESIVVEFTKYFNHFIELGQDYAIAEPGLYYRDFEKETLKNGLIMPSYPASRELCAIGGIANNNSGGEKTLHYGKTDRYVESVTMVMADGNEYEFKKLTRAELNKKKALPGFEGDLYRQMFNLVTENYDIIKAARPDVTKNSAGYALWDVYDKETETFDITKVFVGGQGTLGLMTKVKFKLVHLKKASKLLVIFLKDFSLLGDINNIVHPFNPESFEAYDDNTFKYALKYFPDILHRIKSTPLKIIFKTIPEIWLLLTGGIPKIVLLAEFGADTDEKAIKLAQYCKDALHKKFGKQIKMRITHSYEETQEFWVIRRESFNLLRTHAKHIRTAPFIEDFSVRAQYLPEFLPKLNTILNKYKLLYTVAGHVGDGNFHIIPLVDLTNPKAKIVIKELSDEVYALVKTYKGTITSEHNDGIVRTPFLLQMYGQEVCDLFAKVKHIFDPLNIFNPGKKVGGTQKYSDDNINTHKV